MTSAMAAALIGALDAAVVAAEASVTDTTTMDTIAISRTVVPDRAQIGASHQVTALALPAGAALAISSHASAVDGALANTCSEKLAELRLGPLGAVSARPSRLAHALALERTLSPAHTAPRALVRTFALGRVLAAILAVPALATVALPPVALPMAAALLIEGPNRTGLVRSLELF